MPKLAITGEVRVDLRPGHAIKYHRDDLLKFARSQHPAPRPSAA